MSLTGQVALVTGAGRGIGREVAIGLAREGVRVGLLGRSRANLDVSLSACARAGAKAVAIPTDVTNDAQLRAAVSTVERDLGPLDLVVSNAGAREQLAGAPWESDPGEWWRVVETNLRGPFPLARAAPFPGWSLVAEGVSCTSAAAWARDRNPSGVRTACPRPR
jgi:3-oxoacyl-[acyl-carrier protein] reductase